MKLKNIFAIVVACGAALIMSVAAHAATEVKVEGAQLNEYGDLVLPVVLYTSEIDKCDEFALLRMQLGYDVNKYELDAVTSDMQYYNERGRLTPLNPSIQANDRNNNGNLEITLTNASSNYPVFDTVVEPDENGENGVYKLVICNITFFNNGEPIVEETLSDSDYPVCLEYIVDYDDANNTQYLGTEMNSFFTFNVTGDLDGNNIVGLAVSTDGGITKTPIYKYLSTTLTEDSTDYASAVTNFLVAFDAASDSIVDITVYGLKDGYDENAEGAYIELGNLGRENFLIQDFE